MYQNLQHRRQILLGKAPIMPLSHWTSLQIGQYYLYVHPDLDVTQVADQNRILVLIGSLFDPLFPEKKNIDILNEIKGGSHSLEKLFLQIKRYAGIYALLYKDDKGTYILNDALALREIYYCTNNNRVVCGSQPNLLAKYANPEIGPTTDDELLEFYTSHIADSKWNPMYKWIGDETYYDHVKHLMPNHFLDINKREAHRYWPNEPIRRSDLANAVARACSFLQGIMKAIVERHSVMMAVTAGTDSRTLLAASRDIKDKVYYFVNNQGLGYNHPDISVPKKIFKGIGVPFHVNEVPKEVDDDFRRIFLSNTFFASQRILPTIYNVYYKRHSEKINILGIGEIGRTRFGKEPKNLNSYRLAYKLGYRGERYTMSQCEKILAEMLPAGKKHGVNLMTLYYWEQMLGNWGATGNSESDIAIEEINPFDSHMLYEIFLGVDGRYTKYGNPVLFREMIRAMWPELLKWPINPPHTRREKVAWVLKKVGIFAPLKEIKYKVNYAAHLFKKTCRI